MDIGELLDSVLVPWLKDQKPNEFGSRMALFLVAWWLVKTEVRKHFASVEQKLASIASSMQNFTETMVKIETSHGIRLEALENRIEKIETQGG